MKRKLQSCDDDTHIGKSMRIRRLALRYAVEAPQRAPGACLPDGPRRLWIAVRDFDSFDSARDFARSSIRGPARVIDRLTGARAF